MTEQTSLIVGGNVDIYVEDKITLTKAVIASDTGDLMLDTGSFEYSNIKGNDRSYNVGGGVNVGGNSSKAGDDPVKNKVTYNVRGNYGFSDSRQTNFATIGEGTITVRDTSASLGAGGSSIGNTDEYSGLKRDVSKSQYNTKDGGLQGGFTVDSTTVDLVAEIVDDPSKAYENRKEQIVKGLDDAKDTSVLIYKEAGVAAEKTGNLIEYKHFTTDDKVQYCLNMDDYEEKKANGGEITALDTLVYVKSKSAAGYELDRSDVSDLRLASRYVIDDATNGILENLKANIRVNSREDVNASLAVLDRFDSEDAAAARAYLAGVRESEKQEQNYALQLATDSSLRNAELGLYDETEKIYKDQNIVHKGLGIQNTTTVGSSFSFYTLSAGIESNRTFMGHIELTIDKTDYSNSSITLTGATWTSTNYKTGAGNYHADDNTQYGLGGAVVSAGNSFGFTLEPSANKAIENIAGKSTSIDVSTPVIVGVNVSQSDKNENGNSWRNAGLDVGIGIQATCGRPTTKFDVKKEQDEAIKGTVSLKDIVNSITKD